MTGPPWPVENDIEMLQQLVPYVVVKDIGIRLEGSLLHDSSKVAEWLIEYMENAINTERT